MAPDRRSTFDDFVFDPRTLELTRGGTPCRLQPQPARVLGLLVSRPGELVSRDELRAAIWGDETFVDFDRSLNFCIRQIRAALGDDAEAPRYVETLRGRGYRFVGAPSTAPSAPGPTTAVRPAGPPRPRAHGLRWAAAAAAVILVAAFAWTATSGDEDRRPAVVIVPFGVGAREARDWTSALEVQLAAHFAHASLRVVDAHSAGAPPAAPTWRLEGRVDRSQEQYRVTVVLRDPSDGAVRWSDIFDGPPGDWIDAQNEMARIITAAVRYNVDGAAAARGIPRREPRRRVPFG